MKYHGPNANMASAAVGTVTHGQLGQSSYALGSQVKQKWPRGVVSRYIKKAKLAAMHSLCRIQ